MATYSFSKLNTFDQCPYKYKLQHIDRTEADFPIVGLGLKFY
jgi:ATP-dependent helicase/DNAse subunit B